MLQLPDVKLLDGSIWTPQNNPAPTLVVYWQAGWCPFCAVQSPHVQALWQTQKANGSGVLALQIDKQESAAAACVKSKCCNFHAGTVTIEVAKMLPKPRGLPVLAVSKIDKTGQREGKGVFAEGGKMFPEDIEGLKKYI